MCEIVVMLFFTKSMLSFLISFNKRTIDFNLNLDLPSVIIYTLHFEQLKPMAVKGLDKRLYSNRVLVKAVQSAEQIPKRTAKEASNLSIPPSSNVSHWSFNKKSRN